MGDLPEESNPTVPSPKGVRRCSFSLGSTANLQRGYGKTTALPSLGFLPFKQSSQLLSAPFLHPAISATPSQGASQDSGSRP